MKRPSRLVISLGLAAGLLCLGAGVATWAVVGCKRDDYLNRAAPSWINDRERYLFACGQMWHSLDAGQTWTRRPTQGLPALARDGFIAADIAPGHFYLALLLRGRTTVECPLCAWSEVIPTILISSDYGEHWTLNHSFPATRLGAASIRAMYADPNYPGSAWVILNLGGDVTYFATNTSGGLWIRTCVEGYNGACDPPDDFLSGGGLLNQPHNFATP